jgi:hypothetical protein
MKVYDVIAITGNKTFVYEFSKNFNNLGAIFYLDAI